MSYRRDAAVSSLLVLGCCIALFLIATSCQITRPPVSPYAPILPPGYQPTAQVFSNAAVRRFAVVLPPPGVLVTNTFDVDPSLPFDGVNVYTSLNGKSMTFLAAFGHTNVFAVTLPTNLPSLVEIRTFINWPAPGVIGSFTLDDGTIDNFTNTFYESAGSQFIFVPTNCPAIAIFAMADGSTEVAGWNSGTNLTVQSSSNLQDWLPVAVVTNQGAWQISADATSQNGFWRTQGNSP